MDNHIYNLIKSLSKKAQVVSKYDAYLKDAGSCETCQNLWNKLKSEDQLQLQEIKKVLQSHVKDGTL